MHSSKHLVRGTRRRHIPLHRRVPESAKRRIRHRFTATSCYSLHGYPRTPLHGYTATLSAMLYHVDSTNLVLGGATRAVHISIKSYRAELLKTLHGAS